MKAASLALVLLGFAAATLALRTDLQYQNEFTRWMQAHQKTYHHDEFRHRFAIFRNNLDWIDAHNAEGHTYTVRMNHLGDLTNEEYRKYYLGMKNPLSVKFDSDADHTFVAQSVDLPASLDWRDKGVVTPVKNQEQCGSCWSFSTTGSMEGCLALATSKLISFSEQNLVDCSSSYGNEGCNGGLMTSAMDYIIANGGLDTEESYPYTAKDGSCKYDPKNNGGTLKSYSNVPKGNETALQYAVNSGPVSIAIDASSMSFQFYSSGIYNPLSCSSTNLDHGVLNIGWGADSSNNEYWIVKNSWGTVWGQQGYIWMAKNKNNMCGVATMATLPQC